MNRLMRWALQGLLALLVVEAMAFLAVLRGLLSGWHDVLCAVILVTALAVVVYETLVGTPPSVETRREDDEEQEQAYLRFHLQEILSFASWHPAAQQRYLAYARSVVGPTWQPHRLLCEELDCWEEAEPGSAFCAAHQPAAPDEAGPLPPLALAD
jgi:hypothetical protein